MRHLWSTKIVKASEQAARDECLGSEWCPHRRGDRGREVSAVVEEAVGEDYVQTDGKSAAIAERQS